MELDPRKFAISPSLTLVNHLGGAFHATSCRNLLSIVERGILAGADIEEDYGSRHEAGRLHSYYGIFAPWDSRNTATKYRVSGRGNWRMPLTVLHVPSTDLVRQGGRLTDSGNIIVSRPVPFNLVKRPGFACQTAMTEEASISSRRSWMNDSRVSWYWISTHLLSSTASRRNGHRHYEPAMRHANWTPLCRLQRRKGCCVPWRPQLTITRMTLADITT